MTHFLHMVRTNEETGWLPACICFLCKSKVTVRYSFFFLMKTLRVHYVPYCSGIFFCSLGCTAQCVGFVRGTGYVRENTVGCTMGYYHRCGALWSTTKDMSVIQRDVGMEMMPAQGASICTCLLFFCIFFNVSILCERAGDVLSKYHKENK